MWDRHPVRLSLLHMLPEVAGQTHVTLAPMLARAGLADDALTIPDAVASRSQVCILLDELARRSGEATIGLDLAAAANAPQLGLMGYALLAGRTLRECLMAQRLHMPALQLGVSVELERQGPWATWRHRLADSDPETARVLNEGIAGFMTRAVRSIAGSETAEIRLSLPHRARTSIGIYEDRLKADTRFGVGDAIAVTFDASWLGEPNVLYAAVTGQDQLPAPDRLTGEGDWLTDEAVPAAIIRMLPAAAIGGALSLMDAARTLGIPPRSLQRRLAAFGTSFESLADTWREREARRRLADPAMPIGAIARILGYRDPSHFVRAFRRWEGVTPLAYRHLVMARNGN